MARDPHSHRQGLWAWERSVGWPALGMGAEVLSATSPCVTAVPFTSPNKSLQNRCFFSAYHGWAAFPHHGLGPPFSQDLRSPPGLALSRPLSACLLSPGDPSQWHKLLRDVPRLCGLETRGFSTA